MCVHRGAHGTDHVREHRGLVWMGRPLLCCTLCQLIHVTLAVIHMRSLARSPDCLRVRVEKIQNGLFLVTHAKNLEMRLDIHDAAYSRVMFHDHDVDLHLHVTM